MCGIVGVKALTEEGKQSFSFVENAVQRLNRRGPDHQSKMGFDSVVLGHARLSIIDTSDAAHQPFAEETGRYVITFNGEIYNYKDLREELKSKGHSFNTNSDTEVLLKSFLLIISRLLSVLVLIFRKGGQP